ncbi:hypothetical protein M0R45_006636 [Rubus argutus]|uniref:Uncharacterized protein n=1 Tax=Rubus argutus TaxID=59490 RepID=A0AAW1YRH4_RUBAR
MRTEKERDKKEETSPSRFALPSPCKSEPSTQSAISPSPTTVPLSSSPLLTCESGDLPVRALLPSSLHLRAAAVPPQ